MIKQQINQLLAKEVDRREFLQGLGVAFLALIGVTSLLSSLTKFQSSQQQQSSYLGYGETPYGR